MDPRCRGANRSPPRVVGDFANRRRGGVARPLVHLGLEYVVDQVDEPVLAQAGDQRMTLHPTGRSRLLQPAERADRRGDVPAARAGARAARWGRTTSRSTGLSMPAPRPVRLRRGERSGLEPSSKEAAMAARTIFCVPLRGMSVVTAILVGTMCRGNCSRR